MVRRLTKSALAFMLVAMALHAVAQSAAPTNPDAAIKQARQLLSSLTPDAGTSRYAQVGREFGQVVDGVRSGSATTEQLMTMRDITAKLRERATARLKAAEEKAKREAA